MTRVFFTFLRLLALSICVVILFLFLYKSGFSPIYTDSLSFDLKADHIERHAQHSVDVMAIGSSMTLYNFDSETFLKGKKCSFYNFSSWSLQAVDIEVILKNRLHQYHPKYVVICSNILDFRFQKDTTYTEFYKSILPQIKKFKPALYYTNYYSVYDLIRRKKDIGKITADLDHEYSLRFDDYGGASLNVPKSNLPQDFYTANIKFPTKFTPENYDALSRICDFLKIANIKLIFVQTPINSPYMKTFGSPQIISNHIAKCKAIVETHGGAYFNFIDPETFADSLFVDQFHLQKAGAKILTQKIVDATKGFIQ